MKMMEDNIRDKFKSDYFFYVHSDYLGSSNLLTGGETETTHGGFRFVKGELVQRVEYTPFGKERFVLNSAFEELPKYIGQADDIDTITMGAGITIQC